MTFIREHYKISHNWKGKSYLGLDIDWDYGNRKVHLSIMAYVTDAITRFRHNHPCKSQHQPYLKINPMYGAKSQYTDDADVSPPLSKEDKKFVQEVTGKSLYYERAVDTTMMTTLGSI